MFGMPPQSGMGVNKPPMNPSSPSQGYGQAGMFGNGSNFAPSINPAQWAKNNYDFSGIQKGANIANDAKPLQINQYDPYQYKKSNFNDIGSYGKSSPEQIQNVYTQAYNTGAKPIMAQGAAAMHGLNQGFGGNNMSSAASKQLALRGAQNTGSNLTNLSGIVGTQLADRSLTQDETARANDYATRVGIFNANNQKEINQAGENFKAAGYNGNAAQLMSMDAMDRAKMFMNFGIQVPTLQNQLNWSGMQPWMTGYNNTMGMNATAPNQGGGGDGAAFLGALGGVASIAGSFL